MKRRKVWTRLLFAGTSLALLAGMLPGALAASTPLRYEVDSHEILEIRGRDFNSYCENQTGYSMDYIAFTDLPDSDEEWLCYKDGAEDECTIREGRAVDYNDFYYLVFEPDEDFDQFVYDETPAGIEVDSVTFTDLPSSSKGVFFYDCGGKNEAKLDEVTIYDLQPGGPDHLCACP